MDTRRLLSSALKSLLSVLLPVLLLHAIPSFGASESSHRFPGLLFNPLPVFSDFDGDHKLDQAILSSQGRLKTIGISLGKSSWSVLPFDSKVVGRGSLISGDIDDDGDFDLIWIDQDAGKFVTWLGDGHGNFSIDTGGKSDLNRIRALLGNGESRLADKARSREIQGVLLSTNFVVVRAFEYDPHLSFQPSLVAARAPAVRASCFTVLKQRAPPSDLF